MNRNLKTLSILAIAAALCVLSALQLKGRSFEFFVLTGGQRIEAFRVTLPMAPTPGGVEALGLTRAQRTRAEAILEGKDREGLLALGREAAKCDATLALGADRWEETIAWYFGGGWRALFQVRPEGTFDGLGWGERAYWTLFSAPVPTPPFLTAEIEIEDRTSVPAPAAPPASSRGSAVRMEILNGCGIKGAADWVARRIRGPGIQITRTENADHFRYPTTLVRSSAGVPVALEEALARLGLTGDVVEEDAGLAGDADAVLIIGRDFPKLKERARAGNH